jgi:hypothetical protein
MVKFTDYENISLMGSNRIEEPDHFEAPWPWKKDYLYYKSPQCDSDISVINKYLDLKGSPPRFRNAVWKIVELNIFEYLFLYTFGRTCLSDFYLENVKSIDRDVTEQFLKFSKNNYKLLKTGEDTVNLENFTLETWLGILGRRIDFVFSSKISLINFTYSPYFP